MVKFQYDEIRARGVRLGLALAWLNLYCAWSIMVTCRISSFPIVLDLLWTEIAEAGLIFFMAFASDRESIMAAFLLECQYMERHK